MPTPSPRKIPARDRPQVRLLRAIMRANAALRDSHKELMHEFKLSLTEFDFLAALGNTEGLRMKDLAGAMITTPSNVTRICASMEKKGLAVRQRSSESDREVIAKLTPEGERRFREVFDRTVDFTTTLMTEMIPIEDQVRAADILESIVDQLSSRGQSTSR